MTGHSVLVRRLDGAPSLHRSTGTPRDVATYRVLTRVAELAVTPEIGRSAGALLGSTRLSGATVDAVVAATALRQPGPVLLVTSDPGDMANLTASRSDIAVAAI